MCGCSGGGVKGTINRSGPAARRGITSVPRSPAQLQVNSLSRVNATLPPRTITPPQNQAKANPGMTAERRNMERKRRDIIMRKLGRA